MILYPPELLLLENRLWDSQIVNIIIQYTNVFWSPYAVGWQNSRGHIRWIFVDKMGEFSWTLSPPHPLTWYCTEHSSPRKFILWKCPLEFTHFEKSIHENSLFTRILHPRLSLAARGSNILEVKIWKYSNLSKTTWGPQEAFSNDKFKKVTKYQ